MTFTKDIPTTPGFYAWKCDPDGKPMAVTVQSWLRGLLVFANPGSDPILVKELGGEWCRLVPAEEIEKAWQEGFDADLSHGGICWQGSRAKRVMEGRK